MDVIGKKLGQYQIVEELGRGGMAVVYKAYHAALNRYVAIKVLPPQFAFDQEFVQRFLREARAAAALHHPNIITIHDVTQAEGYYFIVMQFVEGKTLDQVIAESGRLPLPRIQRIMSQVVDALEHAHERGLIHRDVKPSNIMVDEARNDQVTLMDFGLVRAAEDTSLTKTGTIVGTPEYMSPEQAEGGEIDHRTDIYSLGVVLFKMLTGQVPFSKSTPHAVLIAHMTQEPPSVSSISPGLSSPVERVIRKALVKDRQGRYGRVSDFGRDLSLAVEGKMPPALDVKKKRKPVAPQRPEPTRRAAAPPAADPTVVSRKAAPKPGEGKGWMWAVGGLGALFIVGLIGMAAVLLMWDRNGEPSATATAGAIVPATVDPTSDVVLESTATLTPTPTETGTATPTPDASPSPSPTTTVTASPTATATHTPAATSTPRPQPTATPTLPPPTDPPPPPPTDPPPPPPTDPPPPPPTDPPPPPPTDPPPPPPTNTPAGP